MIQFAPQRKKQRNKMIIPSPMELCKNAKRFNFHVTNISEGENEEGSLGKKKTKEVIHRNFENIYKLTGS